MCVLTGAVGCEFCGPARMPGTRRPKRGCTECAPVVEDNVVVVDPQDEEPSSEVLASSPVHLEIAYQRTYRRSGPPPAPAFAMPRWDEVPASPSQVPNVLEFDSPSAHA